MQLPADDITAQQAVNFGAIALQFGGMLATVMIGSLLYVLKTLKTRVSATEWFVSNAWRFVIGVILMLVLAISVVVFPDFKSFIQYFGFNPDASPTSMGVVILLLLIGTTTEPSKNPEG
jgi:hypothetical protein